MAQPDEQSAAAEFDGWAKSGRAESMAEGHRGVTEAALDHWQLDESSVVLDAGCGNGWAVRWLVTRGAGGGIGTDISPGMIDRARDAVGARKTRPSGAPGAPFGHISEASGTGVVGHFVDLDKLLRSGCRNQRTAVRINDTRLGYHF